MPSTQVSPIKILLDLGIDLDNLSSEENYLSALMEGAASIEVASKGKGDGRSVILREEIVRVRKERKAANPSIGMKASYKKISAASFRGVKKSSQGINKVFSAGSSQGEGGGDLVVIKEKVISIEKILGDQFKFQEDQAKEAAEEKERKKRNLKERLLAGAKNIWGGIQKVAGAVIKPFQSIWSKILNFLQIVILGNILMRILRWGAKKENQQKVKSIFKFLADFWPTILASYILFGTGFTKFVANFARSIAWGIGKMAILIPKLIAQIAKLKAGRIIKGLSSLVGGGRLKGLTALMGAGAFSGGGLVQQFAEGGEVKGIDGIDGVDGVDGIDGVDAISLFPEGLGGGGGGTNALTEQAKVKTFGGGLRDFFSGDGGKSRRMTDQEKSQRMATGGFVSGPAGVDRVPAKLTAGEFVMSKGAVQKFGVNTLAAMNAAGGGTNRPTVASGYNSGGQVTKGYSGYSQEAQEEWGFTEEDKAKEKEERRKEKEKFDKLEKREVSPATILKGAVYHHYDASGNKVATSFGKPLPATKVQRLKAKLKLLQDRREQNKAIVAPQDKAIVASQDNSTKVNIEPLSKKKPKVVIVDDPTEEDPMDFFDADIPSGGSREIPSFDATAHRSLKKMEVLGISI